MYNMMLLIQSIANLFKNTVEVLVQLHLYVHNKCSPEERGVSPYTSISPLQKLVCSLSCCFGHTKQHTPHTHTLRFVLLAQSDSPKGGINQLDMT